MSLQHADQQTEPVVRVTFSDMVNQWIIYDGYLEHERQKELQDERDRNKIRAIQEEKKPMPTFSQEVCDDSSAEIAEMFIKAAKTLERMINQNIYDQVIQGKFGLE